ncbi:OmpA family protein [Oryzomonas rubra]|uniref:Outer membrane beta-barrel domain-containing protein n=1 Tax=Oryzomonas rubra TaxID=2509454 RepID=A0A5A9X7T1_9BACT|nr:OmpA family protein [Oryzomonas rubra]KAA0889137.1 outer membrane beta-barrel domain-containing protein [Oryzomonas rubra]
MRKRLALVVVGSIAALATAASAGNKEGAFSLSPVIGGYTYDGVQHRDTTPVFGARLGYNFTKAFGVEGLFDYAHTESTKSEKKFDMYRYGGELLYHFFPDNNLVPYVAAGYAGLNFNDNKPQGAFDYGAGLKYFLTDNFALRGDVRHILYNFESKTINNVEYTVGAYIPFGGTAPVVKPVEAPAPAPTPAPEPPKAVEPPPVAPAPVAPTSTLAVAPAAITKGEPATLSWTSQNATACDIQPGIGAVQPQGSMSITPADNTDYTLTCTGAGGSVTSAAKVAVTVPKPAAKLCSPTTLGIQFDTAKSDIKPKYHDELKKVGDFLTENPGAKGVIEGHTDNAGSLKMNMDLSQRRAESVRAYIIKNFGIAPERISAKGYGPTKPVASNKNAAGKQKNRRIDANFTCDGK